VNGTGAIIATLFSGVIVGVLIAWLIFTGRSSRAEKTGKTSRLSPYTANELLNALAITGLVLDGNNRVVQASIGTAIYGLIDENVLQHPALLKLVESARSTEQPTTADVEVQGRNDEIMNLQARVGNLGLDYVVVILDDRTEARRIDEVRRDFVANVSHELKTPIGAIDLLTRSIRRHVDEPEKVAAYAGDLAKQAERLATLVHDIIELSRFQASKGIGVDETIDITATVSDAIERNQVLAETKKVKVLADLSGRHLVYGDYEQLATAIRNLLENAINYSDEGQTVGVGIKSEGEWCTVSVKDDGAGISPDDQKRVFERFYRVDQSRSRQTGGTGLGLSIVKHIAENHHGRVELASIPGRGSTFSLIIPSAHSVSQEGSANL
jgi:two-component system sensor histidine kinase SenX3